MMRSTVGRSRSRGIGLVLAGALLAAPAPAAAAGPGFSTLLGGTGADSANAVAVDPAGGLYVAGRTASPDFPTTPGAHDETFNGGAGVGDAFVAKLAPDGRSVEWSTFIGGADQDLAFAVEVDRLGRVHVAGGTHSADFPADPRTGGAYAGGWDAFVVTLDRSGSLVTSTLLGGAGDELARGLAVDRRGRAHVTGWTLSADFPTTPGAWDATPRANGDAFVTKLTASGRRVIWSTRVGGDGFDDPRAIALDRAGGVHLTGATFSDDFPVTPGAFAPTRSPGFAEEGFVTALAPSGRRLISSTYLGGNGDDSGRAITIDRSGGAVVAGRTESTDFPATVGPPEGTRNQGAGAFVTALTRGGGSLRWSRVLGGESYDGAAGIAIDPSGRVLVTGETHSADFPTTEAPPPGTFAGTDGYLARLDPGAGTLLDSVRIGGPDFDAANGLVLHRGGDAVVVGQTTALQFPTSPGAFDASANGDVDVFVVKRPLE
jgi:hypothetical protein